MSVNSAPGGMDEMTIILVFVSVFISVLDFMFFFYCGSMVQLILNKIWIIISNCWEQML